MANSWLKWTRNSGAAALVATGLSLVFSACGGSGDGGSSPSDAGTDGVYIECVVQSDCEDDNPCTTDTCVDNACKREVVPGGDALEQTAGDCKKITCVLGTPKSEIDDGDVPDDGEPCTLDKCTNGVPSTTPKINGSKCNIGNGDGECVTGVCYVFCTPANAASQCDDDNPCTEDACLPCTEPACAGKGGKCGHQGLSGMATPGVSQTSGDCKERRCVEGEDQLVDDNTDAPDDGNECTVDLCKAGEPGHLPQSVGTACNGGSYKCDGQGDCVQCVTVADCSGSTSNQCEVSACSSGKCGFNPLPTGTSCGTSGEQCDGSGSCCETCASLGKSCGTGSNGCGTTLDCGTCPSGQTCYSSSCCTPKTCAAGACGSKSDGCGGTITCPTCPSGQTCYSGSCCTPKTCTAGSCGTQSDGCGGTITCGTCAAGDSCSGGKCGCSNGVKSGTETDVDCGGVCATKCAQGLKCLAGSDCTTNNCADGVCCNSACTGTCKACTSALTGQTTGTCANITDGTDPAAECPNTLPSTCGTTGVCKSGACEYHPATVQCGTASCSGSTQFAADYCDGAGSCVDGGQTSCTSPYVCGSTSCQSCTDGVKNGNETGVDCGGGGPCAGCPNGTTCTTGAECSTGNCVDSRCCNTTCTGTCMTCNASGKAGTCSPIAAGLDPADECPGQKTCNGAGGCS